MKRSTAVRHLVEIAEVASDHLRLRDSSIGWPLQEIWVSGSFVQPTADGEGGAVILLPDVPTHELPWLGLHPVGEYVGGALRLGKRPVSWWYRPSSLPAWNCEHRRVARLWTASGGLDEVLVDRLRHGDLEDADVVEPEAAALLRQMSAELEASRTHLRSVLNQYWDREWRVDHRPAEDHLWRAAEAVSTLEMRIDEESA